MNSGITIEELMDAQGLVDKNIYKRYEDNCRCMIADVLLKKNYSVAYPNGNNQNYSFDFEIITDAIPNGNGRWLFEIKMPTPYSHSPTGVEKTKIWLNNAMALYYSGENAGRISIIVNNRTVFEQIRELMSHYKIPDEISVILVSTEKQKVLDEYVMSLSDGQEAKRVLADYQE